MQPDPVRDYGDALAVVTVTRGGRPGLDVLCAALPAATTRPARLVVADTASAARPDVPAGAQLLRLSEDVGRAAAVNRAVAALPADVGWVALADPRLRWGRGALDALLAAAVRLPRAALLGPVGDGPGAGGPLPGLFAVALGRVPAGASPGPTGWLSTAGVLVRRAAWDSVDGFDARYLGGPGEMGDVDLGDRLAAAGWLVVAVPDVVADVEPGDTTVDGHGILESHEAGVRRYVRDRAPAPVRALTALARRR